MQGKKPTARQQTRFGHIQEAGCVACWLEAKLQGREHIPEPPDIHHTNGGDNHDDSYANCPWHHRGVRKCELDYLEMKINFGPSMDREPERYHSRYGSESEMLAFQSAMLDEYCRKWGIVL